MTAVLAVFLPSSGLSGEPAFLRLKRAQIIDQHGFEKPMPAFYVLIPTDWKFEG